MHLGIFLNLPCWNESHREIYGFFSCCCQFPHLCKFRLVRTSHGLQTAHELGSQGCQLGWFHCSESHWHSGFEACLKLAKIIQNPWFIGRICLKHCKQTMIFWCLELMVLVLLSYSSEPAMSWRKLRRMLTHQLRMGPTLSCQVNKISDLVSFASLCFFFISFRFLKQVLWQSASKLAIEGHNWFHDVSPVVDVGETTHIQQLLASKVAELHGIDTVQSLQTLENLVPWVNIPTCSMYGISTHILASIYGTCRSIFHTFGAYGIHQSRKKVHEKLPYMAQSTIYHSTILVSS